MVIQGNVRRRSFTMMERLFSSPALYRTLKKRAAPDIESGAAREPVSRDVSGQGVREESSPASRAMRHPMVSVRKCSLTFGSHSSP